MEREEQKPDWVTDWQWENIPYVEHWEMQQRIAELQKQQKPLSADEMIEQQRRAYEKAGIKIDS